MSILELFETRVNSDSNQVVILFSDKDDFVTTTICHSRIDLEEQVQIICNSFEDRELKNNLWDRAGLCKIPNYHQDDPIAINGFCGKYLYRALLYWEFISRTGFKPIMTRPDYRPGVMPYTLYYPPSNYMATVPVSAGRNVVLVTNDDSGNCQADLIYSYDQLVDTVVRTAKLSKQHVDCILHKVESESILPKYGISPLKTFDGGNAKLISEVMSKHSFAVHISKPYQEVAWAGHFN